MSSQTKLANQTADGAITQLHPTEARWFAVYTEYKREKLVAKHLRAKGIEVYLPLQKKTRRYTRKVRQVELPLINCYIFAKIITAQYIPVLETEHVLWFLKQRRDLLMVREEEIELMKMVIGERDVLLEPGKFSEGQLVEIIGGELTGLRGYYVSTQSKKEIVIELTDIGYLLRMTVDPKNIRRVT